MKRFPPIQHFLTFGLCFLQWHPEVKAQEARNKHILTTKYLDNASLPQHTIHLGGEQIGLEK
jgi:hypothetical protein